ncbi:hypothetical protein GUJ93_ZPchr0001g29824 [Zizania palustris]|uniref:DUF4378 domain-containing protein n=1 Tax=Zizania palustris TaxID=103762 RepID=A0A8J5VT47_ZIZPA|nr:hypothetical protein GUJ93_ZPchr0001g29824 [Zizania palustris]
MSSLAIVEKRPPPFAGGGCTGGVLFHLLDWHRRLARKRRLFSPRRLLPSSLRSSPRRLPSSPPTPPPPPAPRLSAAADGAAPGVVARLMGLESWPARTVGAPAARRPQKQRKVELSTPRGDESAVVVVLPQSQRPPAPSPSPALRSHHGADLPARSPRRSRLMHAAATKLLDPEAHSSSTASTRLALAYACSSPKHRMDGHSSALQISTIPDDFFSRSEILPLERSSRLRQVAVQPPVLPADTEWDNAITSSSRREKHTIDTMSSSSATDVVSGHAIVVLRSDFDGANASRSRIESSDALSGKLTGSVLQELISALSNDTNISDSHHGNYSVVGDPLDNDISAYNSNDQSPDFQKCYQRDQEVDSCAACTNDEPNQPSPTSVLEARFSNDTSSLGSPVEESEGKEFFVSIENKMEDLFNLESDIVDLAMSIDTRKTDSEEIFHGSGKMSSVHNFAAHDFKLLEARLDSIGEAISNAELLLGSSPLCSTRSSLSLHSFIIEMLEIIVNVFGGSESLGLTEEKKYQRTNFLFDCIIESMNSKFCDFGKCGYKAWLRLPLSLSKDLLKREISEEICKWRETKEATPNRVAENDLDQMAVRWEACQVEAFDISIAIENDILEALVDEFAVDQC